jgi:hypothetical protein
LIQSLQINSQRKLKIGDGPKRRNISNSSLINLPVFLPEMEENSRLVYVMGFAESEGGYDNSAVVCD